MRQFQGGLSLVAIALAEITYPHFATVTQNARTYPARNIVYTEHRPTPTHPTRPYTMHRTRQSDPCFDSPPATATTTTATTAAAAAAAATNTTTTTATATAAAATANSPCATPTPTPTQTPTPTPTPTPAPTPTPTPTDMPSALRSSASSLQEMVPITFEMLTDHYARFPSPSIDADLSDHLDTIISLRNALLSSPSTADTTTVNEIMSEALPASLDNSMYCLRCACEEAAQRVESVPSLRLLSHRLLNLSNTFDNFQSKQSQHVSKVINEFLPQDFRASFFNAARQHSERSNVTAINDLMAAGGSVRDKYKLLWDQQWKRRETLASVGNATGMWKWVVKYLAGVPEPLLQFAREINSPKGPTEALRNKFGTALSQLTNFAVELNAFCAAAALVQPSPDARVAEQVERGIACYEGEAQKFVQLLETVITNSPFFVQPEEIAALKTETS